MTMTVVVMWFTLCTATCSSDSTCPDTEESLAEVLTDEVLTDEANLLSVKQERLVQHKRDHLLNKDLPRCSHEVCPIGTCSHRSGGCQTYGGSSNPYYSCEVSPVGYQQVPAGYQKQHIGGRWTWHLPASDAICEDEETLADCTAWSVVYAETPSCQEGATIAHGSQCTPACSAGYIAPAGPVTCNNGVLPNFVCEQDPAQDAPTSGSQSSNRFSPHNIDEEHVKNTITEAAGKVMNGVRRAIGKFRNRGRSQG